MIDASHPATDMDVRTPIQHEDLTYHPLTADRWDDLERLFGPRGACGGCWCMWWRIPNRVYEQQKGDGNKATFKALVNEGTVPGLLAYAGDEPIAWCAVAPREEYGRLARSRILKPVDETPVWSIVCFFVAKPWRKRGVTVALLRAAVEHVAARGGRVLEGYPVEPKNDEIAPVFACTGLASAYRTAGFDECARRSPTRPIMRRAVGKG